MIGRDASTTASGRSRHAANPAPECPSGFAGAVVLAPLQALSLTHVRRIATAAVPRMALFTLDVITIFIPIHGIGYYIIGNIFVFFNISDDMVVISCLPIKLRINFVCVTCYINFVCGYRP